MSPVPPSGVRFCCSWSGGKDSCLALHRAMTAGALPSVLLTMFTEEGERSRSHGLRRDVIAAQVEAIGLPLHKLYISTRSPETCQPASDCAVMQAYEELMMRTMLDYKAAGILTIAFGDIFLQRLREYREANLAKVGMRGLFPIWQRDTTELVKTFIELGFQAHLTCVDAAKLGETFAGRMIDADLLRDLPAGVDPCAEHGEYHSFVFDGPIFSHPVGVTVGEVILRDIRYFADLKTSDRANPKERE